MMKNMLLMSVLVSLMIPNIVLSSTRPETLHSVFLPNDYEESEDKKIAAAYDEGGFRRDFDDSGGVSVSADKVSKTNQLLHKLQNDINNNGIEEDLEKFNQQFYYNNNNNNDDDDNNNNEEEEDNGNVETKRRGDDMKLLELYPGQQKRQDLTTNHNKDLYRKTLNDGFGYRPVFDPLCNCWKANQYGNISKKNHHYSINAPLAVINKILEAARKRQEEKEIKAKLLALGRR